MTKTDALDSYDRDTLGYLSAFPQIGDAIMRRVEKALVRGAQLEAELVAERAKVARVQALLKAWDEIPDYMPSHYDRGRVDQRHMAAEELATVLEGDA